MGKVAVVYWSGSGNTAAMAKEIAAGAEAAGTEVSLFTATEFSPVEAAGFDKIAFGCSAMGAEELEETEFLESNLQKADFRNATEYKIDIMTCNLKGARFSFPEAINLLNVLKVKID